jgi:dienelactone hydrolase
MPQLLRNAALGERMRRAMKPALLQLALAYTLDKERAEQAAIPAERVKAPLLCLSGADDAVWPSARMTKAILERRRRARRAGYDEHGSYPRAGHLIRPPYLPTTAPGIGGIALGGSPGGHAAAEADAWRRVLAFLRQHLGAARPART